MSSDEQSQSFWTSMNGILTGVVVLLTVGAFLLFVLVQAGVLGSGDDSSGTAAPTADAATTSSATTSPSATTPESTSTGSPQSTSSSSDDPGHSLAGTWTGTAASTDGDFDVVLTIDPDCALRKPCGSISVSSAPCTGRVRLWKVEGTTYELYVDRFSDDSSPDCTAGAGELFERVDDGHLRYTTDYSDAVALLQRG